MKKTIFIFVLLSHAIVSIAQFSNYFEDKTLRVDYFRKGCKKNDTIYLKEFISKPGIWAGSYTHTLDPFNYGQYRVVVKDLKTKEELYSRTYNTLFGEYTATPKGVNTVETFEETVLVPFPKIPVEIHLQKRDSDWNFYTASVFDFNPRITYTSTIENTTETRKLHYSGDPHKKVDIAIIADGYSIADTAKMRTDFEVFKNGILQYEPFKSHRNNINIWGIAAISNDSGITDPLKKKNLNTAVGSTFNVFDIDRYIMTFQIHKLHTALQNAPYEQIIIMSNTKTYGGGAIYNCYADVVTSNQAAFIVTHELGHCFAGLADEYVDPNVSYNEIHDLTKEPLEPNITTLVNFDSKWKALLNENTPIPTPVDSKYIKSIGVFEGGGYQSKGIYRPTIRCMMNTGGNFCPVCKKAIDSMFKIYTE